MATIVYQWNPFQEVLNNNISREVIKVSAEDKRKEFIPRNAPFFSRGVKVYRQGSSTPLTLGVDYAFAHPFAKFTTQYKRNAYGSVVLLKDIDTVIEMDYSTIGSPFVLDEAALAAAIANLVNSPHSADWNTLVNVPAGFPADPHVHPAAQTYDYEEMMVALNSLVATMIAGNEESVTMNDLLKEHMSESLAKAHKASPADIGLDLTPNMPAAEITDLAGNSAVKLVTVSVLKTALRQLIEGSLALGPTSTAPQPPSNLRITSTTIQGVIIYSVYVSGGAGVDGKAVTYKLTQSGEVGVVFSKTTGIVANEQVTFTAPDVNTQTKLTIGAATVDSIGVVSDTIESTVLLEQSGDSDLQTTYFMGQF